MTDPTRPLSIRLKTKDIDRLGERAKRISGTPTGVARELILSGLSDGDPFTQAERLLKIERKLAALGQDIRTALQTGEEQTTSLSQIEAMFDQLLHALAGQPHQKERGHVEA